MEKRIISINSQMMNNPEVFYLLDFHGEAMFNMHTQYGLPPQDTFAQIKKNFSFKNEELAMIVYRYQIREMKHKLGSGIGKSQQKKLQTKNRRIIGKIIDTGEWDI